MGASRAVLGPGAPYSPSVSAMVIHPSCVGTFFPSDADELRARVERLLKSAAPPLPKGEGAGRPKAIIAPHAGYDYSGPIAASAYAVIAPSAGAIRRVVLLGTCHVVRADGLLTTSAEAFATPLGNVPVDTAAVEQAGRQPHVAIDDAAHRADHALAVQLPWLQVVLDRFEVVPFLVGRCAADDVAAMLDLLWGGDETLIVVSSDLSHFLDYDGARSRDRQTAAAIVALNHEAIAHVGACGHRAIAGLLLAARRHRLRAAELDVRNSGDTAGDRKRVVGYGAFVFEQEEETEGNSQPGVNWIPRQSRGLTI
jgi:AmmeMemoRadiSam system protein B